jgi:tetratricopeptide (TPR) repeat protein
MAMDPTLAEPVTALGIIVRDRRQWLAARPLFEQALAMQPGDASVHFYRGQWLIGVGYTRAGIEELDRALAIDPLLPNALNWRGYQYLFAGDLDRAEALLARAQAQRLTLTSAAMSELARRRGDFPRARELALQALLLNPGDCFDDSEKGLREVVAGTLGGDAAARARSAQLALACDARHLPRTPGWVVGALMRLGQPAKALEIYARQQTTDDAGFAFRVWGDEGTPMRRLPEFGAAARRIGWAAAWDRYGPPDKCTRVAPGEYTCR